MFWRYNLITGSCIETLLDKENVTLKELMDEEDILQECKAQTRKLLDFLVRPEILDEMVSLIIEEPKDEGDERLRYRYANRACELLTFDIPVINDALVGEEALLKKLYDFLSTDGPLNPLLASFFSKTMGLLITKKTEVMYEYLKEKDFLSLILKHLDTSAIMDLLLRFTTIENEMRTTIIKWLNDEKIIQKLVGRIDIEYGEEFNCNASHALCDIIKVSREQMSLLQEKAEPNPLLEAIESVEVVTDLLNHMFKDVTKESAIINGVLVLLSLLVFKKQGPAGIQQMPSNQGEQQAPQADNAPSCFLTIFRNCESEQITALDAERLAYGVYNVVTAIMPRLDDFHSLLLKPPVKPAITFTIGCLDPPLGNCRLEVAHLLTALLYTNDHQVNVKLASLGTITVLIDMFFKYSWNNFLHTQVEQAIGRLITNPPTADKEGNKVHPLLEQLIVQYKMTIKIVDSFNEEPVKVTPGVHRKGYMGHLTKLANHIVQNAENGVNSSLMKEKMQELTEDSQKKWDEFVLEKLAEVNKKNRVYVVSGPAMSSSTDEDSVDFRDVPFGKDSSVHLAFSDYQMHEMTSNFVDQFGFNDDEFGDAEEGFASYGRRSMIEDLSPVSQNVQVTEEDYMRNAELFEQLCKTRLNPEADSIDSVPSRFWPDEESPVKIGSCFRVNKSVEENSSDSDEESQVFEAESTPIVMSSEETKMDVDAQEAVIEGVPMEVAPVVIPNPWESTTTVTSSSEDQQNWADFSNFASFGNAPSETPDLVCSSVSVAMETSESPSAEKCVIDSNSVAVVEGSCHSSGDSIPLAISSTVEEPKPATQSIGDSQLLVTDTNSLSKDVLGTVAEPNTPSSQ